jgi:hypothetical protein
LERPIERRRIYVPCSQDGRLWQGEIISDVPQVRLSLDSLPLTGVEKVSGAEPPPQVTIDYPEHPLVVVMSQDCDLEQDFRARGEGRSVLEDILLCDVHEADRLRARLKEREKTASSEWKEIKENRNQRFQFLSVAPPEQDAAGEGLPALAIDFRLHFTVPKAELYERLRLRMSKKRCRLQTPYVEHLVHRFHHYQSRVPLSIDHPTDY